MRTILDNGLTVVLQANRAARVCAMQLWVKVGSADETEAEAGLAHLHEHMLFKGTRRRGPGEVARQVEACGGEVNAWTSFDQTVYHLVLASDFIDEGLDILADQVTESVFDAGELAREIEVVCEEIRRAEDMPGRIVSRELFATSFRTHPYKRPVLGYERTVRALTREQILAFYARHYSAGNMVFVGVGDFDEERMLASVERAFRGARPGSPPKPITRIPESRQREPRATVKHAPVHEVQLSLGWHIPPLGAKDVAALDLLAGLLGQGDASRLEQRVKREKALVNDASASAYTPKDPGLFVVGASMAAANVEAALVALLEEVERVRAIPVGDDELSRAKRNLESEAVFQRETVQGQARKLGFYEVVAGHVDEEAKYLDAVAACTPDELRAVAERHLHAGNLTLSLVGREGEVPDAARLVDVARGVPGFTRLDAGAAAPYVRLSANGASVKSSGIEVERLASGVTLVVKSDPAVPIVSLRAAWLGGLRAETPDDNGANLLLSRALMRGTAERSGKRLAEEIDSIAASVGGSTGRNSFGASGTFLAANFAQGVDLFTDVLLQPALDEAEVAKERTILLEDIRSRDDRPSSVVFSLFSQALYDRHPYRLELTGTEASASRLTGDSLRAYHTGRYRLDGLVVCAVGAVGADVAKRELERRLTRGVWGKTPAVDVAAEPPLAGPREVSKRLDRKQAHLVVGFRGASMRSPQRHALSVLQSVLSGQGGRLFLELRDKKSLCYSVIALNGEGIDTGYFGVYIGTSPEKVGEAKAGIRTELERLLHDRIAPDELLRAQRHLVGAHEIGLQRYAARAAVMALDECYGLGASHHLSIAERIFAVTADDVREAARTFIDFDRSVTALVSPDA